jgi:hypothetical protein
MEWWMVAGLRIFESLNFEKMSDHNGHASIIHFSIEDLNKHAAAAAAAAAVCDIYIYC